MFDSETSHLPAIGHGCWGFLWCGRFNKREFQLQLGRLGRFVAASGEDKAFGAPGRRNREVFVERFRGRRRSSSGRFGRRRSQSGAELGRQLQLERNGQGVVGAGNMEFFGYGQFRQTPDLVRQEQAIGDSRGKVVVGGSRAVQGGNVHVGKRTALFGGQGQPCSSFRMKGPLLQQHVISRPLLEERGHF